MFRKQKSSLLLLLRAHEKVAIQGPKMTQDDQDDQDDHTRGVLQLKLESQ